MSYNTKNYTEQGGNVTHIGGKLILEEGSSVEGLPTAANQADSTATDVAGLKADLNGLLSKLKAAGLMVADTPVTSGGTDDTDEDETTPTPDTNTEE